MLVVNKGKVPIKSWCQYPESGAIDQAVNLANHPAVFKHVALMPDTHQGNGMPIGGVVAFENAICPNAVGVDIACGMYASKLDLKKHQLNKTILKDIIVQIKRDIPMGFNHQSTDKWKKEAEVLIDAYKKICSDKRTVPDKNMEVSNVYSQLGTLGGGNHFVEIQYDENDDVWFMIHSGSRNIGKQVCDKYDKIAIELCAKWKTQLPAKDLAFIPVDTQEGHDYLNNMFFCTDFSFKNRECMGKDIVYAFNRILKKDLAVLETINIHHNYVSLEHHFGKNVWVHRKGATSAKDGQLGIIPGSMGDISVITKGKGNPESFMSCSHGAGRKMSRSKAKANISLDDFKIVMDGIVSLDIDKEHLDESPMSYKDIKVCLAEQTDLIDIVHTLNPMANCKG